MSEKDTDIPGGIGKKPGFSNTDGQGIAGHGSFFQESNLNPEEAVAATEWVKKHVDRRTLDLGERMDDIRDHMWEPRRLWHHKSCGQCGNIPGYPTSLLWLMNEFGYQPGVERAAASAATFPVIPPPCCG